MISRDKEDGKDNTRLEDSTVRINNLIVVSSSAKLYTILEMKDYVIS